MREALSWREQDITLAWSWITWNSLKKDFKSTPAVKSTKYYPSVEWDIMGFPAERRKQFRPYSEELYPHIQKNCFVKKSYVLKEQ